MTMYFDFKVNIKPKTLVNCIEWHQQLSFLAVGLCCRSPLQSFVSVFDQLVISHVSIICVPPNKKGLYCLLKASCMKQV